MAYKVEINSIKDREAVYYENNPDTGKQEILFDFEIVNSTFSKGVVYLFPETFSNWSNGAQEQLTVYQYIKVIKRVLAFFNDEFPKHHILFGGKSR
jgi:hypothetical protein